MMKPDEIAKAFLHEMNPTNWDGQGEMPAELDTRIMEFTTDMPDVLQKQVWPRCSRLWW